MKRDRRLSVALHLLLHLGGATAITSDVLAKAAGSHAVVMRRTMAGLRVAGIVRSEKGHGGGWTLARPLDQITLADVYAALGEPTIFAMGDRTDAPGCLVEQAVNTALHDAFADAERVLRNRFAELTLAELLGAVVHDPRYPNHAPKRKKKVSS